MIFSAANERVPTKSISYETSCIDFRIKPCCKRRKYSSVFTADRTHIRKALPAKLYPLCKAQVVFCFNNNLKTGL